MTDKLEQMLQMLAEPMASWEKAYYGSHDERVIRSPVPVSQAAPLFQAGYEAANEEVERLRADVSEFAEAWKTADWRTLWKLYHKYEPGRAQHKGTQID